MGTATTFGAISARGEFLGGLIMPGVRTQAAALGARTAQLPDIAPARQENYLGRAPEEAIARGIYFGHLGAVREIVAGLGREAFGRKKVFVVGTGGYAGLLAGAGIFDVAEPDLVLRGLASCLPPGV
jgi:type III pantothenate kinase